MSIVKTQNKKNTGKTKGRYSFSEMSELEKVTFNSDSVSFYLKDLIIITIPLDWLPKLMNASEAVKENYAIRGHFVFWDEADEIIGVKNLLNGSIVPK